MRCVAVTGGSPAGTPGTSGAPGAPGAPGAAGPVGSIGGVGIAPKLAQPPGGGPPTGGGGSGGRRRAGERACPSRARYCRTSTISLFPSYSVSVDPETVYLKVFRALVGQVAITTRS